MSISGWRDQHSAGERAGDGTDDPGSRTIGAFGELPPNCRSKIPLSAEAAAKVRDPTTARALVGFLLGAPFRLLGLQRPSPVTASLPRCALWRGLEAQGLNAFDALHAARSDAASDRIRAKARPLIYGYGAVSAGAGAIPVPFVGLGGLAGVLAFMLRTLADTYGVAWTPGTFAQFSGAVGGGAFLWWVVRYGLREVLKVIPVVGTMAAGALNAVTAFAVTIGVGEAACVWLGYRHRGLIAPDREVRRAFSEGLAAGLRQAKKRTKRPGELG